MICTELQKRKERLLKTAIINSMDYQILETIKQAARAKRVLKIIYIEKNGTSEDWRYIEPYSFRQFEEDMGLFAWDRGKEGIRLFMVNRIQNAEITDIEYSPRYPIEIY